MRIAKDLGLRLDEALEMTTLELKLWAAFYSIEYEEQKKAMNKGR